MRFVPCCFLIFSLGAWFSQNICGDASTILTQKTPILDHKSITTQNKTAKKIKWQHTGKQWLYAATLLACITIVLKYNYFLTYLAHFLRSVIDYNRTDGTTEEIRRLHEEVRILQKQNGSDRTYFEEKLKQQDTKVEHTILETVKPVHQKQNVLSKGLAETTERVRRTERWIQTVDPDNFKINNKEKKGLFESLNFTLNSAAQASKLGITIVQTGFWMAILGIVGGGGDFNL